MHYTTSSNQNQGASLVYHPQFIAVYHQCEALHIINSQKKYTLTRDDIQPKGLMIYECTTRPRRVIHSMIYQLCELDKKSRIETMRLFWWAIRDSNPGPTGYEPVALTN